MTNSHPRLISRVRRRKSGAVVVYYEYDMRPEGKPDIPLGKDYAEALKRWEEIHHGKPRIAGTLLEAMEAWEKEALPLYDNAGTKRNYVAGLKRLKPVFGPATWDTVEFPHLKQYLRARKAKTQGNREMALLSIIWNWARGEGYTKLPWPAAGMERSRWKNKEEARRFEVTDAIFDAIYAEAEPMLRDCMDLATATGMRLTDCRQVALPRGDVLTLKASKTGKAADFDVSLSAVLPGLLERRRALGANHTMLLSMPNGQPVTASMLRGAYDRAREKAAEKADAELAASIRAMYLRDCRKRAADLAADDDEASKLLQHSSKRVTQIHYRTRAEKVKPVR